MSSAQPFQPALQPVNKSLSSIVNFSDPSYEMPYFVDVDAPAMKSSGVSKKPIASQPEASTRRILAPNYKPEDTKGSMLRKNVVPATSKGIEHGPLLPPSTLSYKPNPAAFIQSFEFPHIQNYNIEPKCSGSSIWLVKDPFFLNWKSSKHGLLWLKGSEGCGKSTLMEHALHTQLQGEPSTIHLTYSFSMCGSELPRTRLGFLKAILHQLIPKAPEAFDDMKARYSKHGLSLYVDGIDRSAGETAAKLVQDFSKLLEKSQPKPSPKEPNITHGLKIIFSSTIFPAKEPFPQSYINVDEKNGPSLRQFLEEQLSTTDSNTGQLVLSKSGPSFISARLIIHHIKLFGPMQSSLVQQPSPTPAPISFLLGDYFQNMAQQRNRSLASLLSWICLTTRPLTLAELRVALSLDMIPKLEYIKDLSQAEPFSRYSSDESFQSWIKTTSWGLLETVNLRGQKVVKVMHDSVSSFFLSKGLVILSYSSQPPDSSNSPLQISHRSLAMNILRYLVLLTKEPQWEKETHKEPTLELLRYAGCNWSNHMSAAGLVKPDASKILKLLQWPSDSIMNVLVKFDQENHAVGELQGKLWSHIFAVYGHAPLLSVALKKAGNEALGLLDNQKRTPLHHAALHGHLAASKQLLKSGAKADARAVNGQTALHFAVLQGRQSVLKLLVDSDAGLVSATNHLGQTPLLLAVIRGTSPTVKLLLERHADVKTLDRFKSSVLHHAVGTDKPSLLKILLDSGADMNSQNTQGHTPLHLAISENHPAIIKLLLERGCRVDIPAVSGRTALHVAAASGNKSCAQEILKRKAPADTKDRDGQTALVYAVEGLHVSLVKLFLESKTDVNARNKKGFNVLMVAVRVNQEKITKLLLDADPDLNVLSSEGHTVIFYAVYRGKSVSLLTEQEQLVASLLLKYYKKKHLVWNAEWIACKEKFMAEHGRKKGDAKPKSKPKSECKKTAAQPPSVPVPQKKHARKTANAKSDDISKVNADAKMSAPNPSTLTMGPRKSVRPDPKGSPKPDAKPDHKAVPNTVPKADHKPNNKLGTAVTTQSRTATNAYSPFNSGNPMTSPPLPQRPTATPNNSVPVSTGTYQEQQSSTFMPYQSPQPTVGNSVYADSNTGSGSLTGQQRVPINHRGSWDMYTALSASSPVSAQATPTDPQSPYASYSGASQQATGGGSFKPFQPFQPNLSYGSPSSAVPQPRSQSDDRYSLPSQSSYSQGNNLPGKQVTQQGTVQGYQPFGSNPQKPSPSSYQPQVPDRKLIDSSVKSVAPLSVGRKPVGGHQSEQPMAVMPGKSSPLNHLRPSQSLVEMAQATPGKPQAQNGAVSLFPLRKNAFSQAAPGKQSIAPATYQKSAADQYAVPTQKPHTPQHDALSRPVISSERPALAQKPAAHVATSQKPVTAQQPVLVEKPTPSQKPSTTPMASTPSTPQQPVSTQKPTPGQLASSQKPFAVSTASKLPTTQHSAVTQKPAETQPLSAHAPTSGQAASLQRPSLPQKPASAQQPGPAIKPSLAQKPATNQQVISNEKRPSPSGPVAAPGKPTLAQTPDTSVHKKPIAPTAYPSQSSSPLQSTSGQRSIETHASSSTYTQSQEGKHSSGNTFGGKVAAAAGAGVLAGAAGGYVLSSHVQEHYYESNSINNESSSSDNGYYQPVPPTYYTENYYMDTPGEPSEHSEEHSEAGESEDDHELDNESEDDHSISFSGEASESGDFDNQALLEKEHDDVDAVDFNSDLDEDDSEDDTESLDLDQDEFDSPGVATDSTDEGELDDDDDDDDDGTASDEDTGFRDMHAESDSGLDTDLGQDDSDSDSDSDSEGDAGQNFESDEETDNEPEQLHGNYQQQILDQSDSENEGQQGQYDNFQRHVVDDSDSEDEVQQDNFQQSYQQQTFQQQASDGEEQPDYYHQQGHFQQQVFQQPDSDEEQPVHYSNYQQQVVDQSDSEDKDEVQQNHYHDPYQQQGNYNGQYQHQSPPDSDDGSDGQVDEQTGYNEGGNGYGQQNYSGGGYYEGAGYDSDY
ncbi:ankyrin 3 [Fusarium langsethiae]|uniref:Ankyrin 3 n=1 Tax=Fusarium langsethiae TaxID=179993 RepID=A0A0N0V8H7_FUSLA|nr:ankyrin 3 [Fusarium langsethiae]GKT98016.1 unnamed protein product [Fusarium langsethiae]